MSILFFLAMFKVFSGLVIRPHILLIFWKEYCSPEILDKEEYILRLFLRIVFLHQEPTFLEMAETVATAVFNYPTSVNKLPQPDLLLQIICQVSGRIASYVKVA